MKTKSLFKALPPEEQQKIIDLCNRHTYHEVLAILAKPRPEGLQIETSYSALCRFYCAYNEAARKAKILNQAASSLQFVRQDGQGSFRSAVLATLEVRIFEALQKGVPISELKDDFAVLKDFHKGFMVEEKWRHEPKVEAEKEARLHHVCNGNHSHYDFLPLDESGRPTEPAPLSPGDIAVINQLEVEDDEITETDIAKLDLTIAAYGEESGSRHAIILGLPQRLVKERVQAHRESLRARGITAVQAAIEARRKEIGLPASDPSAYPEKSTSIHQKSLENPHYPPEST
jgi:hypothetical protein